MTPFSRLNFDALCAFSVFAESTNFSAAARRLHVSQPALHVKIRKLSEQLDRPLYRRVGSRLELTSHGEAVARFGRHVRSSADAFLDEFTGRSASSPVTLAAGEGAYLYLLGESIRKYQRDAITPLRLLSLDRERTLEAVLGGEAQLGVAPLENVPEPIQAVPLTTVGQVLAVPAGHRLAGRDRLSLKDLTGERIVVPPTDRPHRQTLAAILQSENIDWIVAMEASGWELMLSFVQMGVGVAVVNACCRMPKGVVTIPIPALPSLRYQCFRLRNLAGSKNVERLRSLLISNGDRWKSRG